MILLNSFGIAVTPLYRNGLYNMKNINIIEQDTSTGDNPFGNIQTGNPSATRAEAKARLKPLASGPAHARDEKVQDQSLQDAHKLQRLGGAPALLGQPSQDEITVFEWWKTYGIALEAVSYTHLTLPTKA